MKRKKEILIGSACFVLAAVFVFSVFNTPKPPDEEQSFAMGSPVRITVYGEKDGETKARAVAEKVTELDEKYLSHTLASSYVYKLNSERTTESDEYFKNYLSKCIELSKDCENFTLYSGRLKALWKIEDGGYVPSEDEIKAALPEGEITFDGNTISLPDGLLIDLGALGKGTACQAAVEELKRNGVKNAVCTVGGTVGAIGSPDGKSRFTVGVRNPFGTQNEYFGTLSVTDCYISTSGDYEKYFEKDGVRYSHIFDAKTGYPVNNGLTAVTVVANDGTVSDFLSTAIFILGEEKGMLLAERYGAQVIIVKKDKTVIVSDGLRDKFALTDNGFTVMP